MENCNMLKKQAYFSVILFVFLKYLFLILLLAFFYQHYSQLIPLGAKFYLTPDSLTLL